MNVNEEDTLYKEIEEEARKRLESIDEKMLGYTGLLKMEIHKIYDERGIPWKVRKEGISEN